MIAKESGLAGHSAQEQQNISQELIWKEIVSRKNEAKIRSKKKKFQSKDKKKKTAIKTER